MLIRRVSLEIAIWMAGCHVPEVKYSEICIWSCISQFLRVHPNHGKNGLPIIFN